MISAGLWKFLHAFFSISYVGTVLAAHWNMLVARRTRDWGRRAGIFEAMHRTTLFFGVSSLIALGLIGNLAAARLGYRMASHLWLRWANGLWILAGLLTLLVELPAARRLAGLAGGATGGAPPGYEAALGRWRAGNSGLLVLVVAFIWLMVFPWKS
jgi:uncharacterized membrane protein